MSIHDHDCDVDLPCPVDEQFISDSGKIPEAQQTTPLLATIHVVRSIGQLAKTLRSPVITAATLEIFDRHFNACLATFPIHYHPSSDQYLDPRSLPPIIICRTRDSSSIATISHPLVHLKRGPLPLIPVCRSRATPLAFSRVACILLQLGHPVTRRRIGKRCWRPRPQQCYACTSGAVYSSSFSGRISQPLWCVSRHLELSGTRMW